MPDPMTMTSQLSPRVTCLYALRLIASSMRTPSQTDEMRLHRWREAVLPDKVRGPQTTTTAAATREVITAVTRGSKNEPWIGNSCQATFIVAWKSAAANTLLPALL